jgi:hypothetical protein
MMFNHILNKLGKIATWKPLSVFSSFFLLTACRSESEYEALRQSNESLHVWLCIALVGLVVALVAGNMMGVRTVNKSRKSKGGDGAKIYRLKK